MATEVHHQVIISLFKDGVDEFGVSWEGEGDGELTLTRKDSIMI